MKNRQSITYIGDEFGLKNKEVGFLDYYEEDSYLSFYLNYEGEIQKYFNHTICKWLMKKYSKFCNYVSVSLFPSESNLEEELKSDIPLLDIKDEGYQKFLYFNLSDEVSDYFLRNYLDKDEKIRWFSFNYYVTNKAYGSVLGVNHCGEEYHLKLSDQLTKEDIVKLLESNNCSVSDASVKQ